MKIPNSNRKKAIFIIDVQSAFIDERNKYIIPNILKLLDNFEYDLYFDAVFYAEKNSLWDKQNKWICPKDEQTKTVDEIKNKANFISIEKQTKSIFKGNQDVLSLLKENDIEEIHIVGTETNDCIIASAYESFDLGFITYVIEECSQSATSDELHNISLEILKRQHLTNNSCVEEIPFKEIF